MLDMQASHPSYEGMQYTLRNIPPKLDAALRRKAKAENRSLNDVAVQTLARALGLGDAAFVHRDLRDLAGTWVDDPDFDEALAEQDRIDREMWT
jgi:hypothetical protein